jgi:hypothetical protein
MLYIRDQAAFTTQFTIKTKAPMKSATPAKPTATT